MKTNEAYLLKILQLSREMIILADEGQSIVEDDGCRLLCGIVQDCAYKIRLEAERERQAHWKTSKRPHPESTGGKSV